MSTKCMSMSCKSPLLGSFPISSQPPGAPHHLTLFSSVSETQSIPNSADIAPPPSLLGSAQLQLEGPILLEKTSAAGTTPCILSAQPHLRHMKPCINLFLLPCTSIPICSLIPILCLTLWRHSTFVAGREKYISLSVQKLPRRRSLPTLVHPLGTPYSPLASPLTRPCLAPHSPCRPPMVQCAASLPPGTTLLDHAATLLPPPFPCTAQPNGMMPNGLML